TASTVVAARNTLKGLNWQTSNLAGNSIGWGNSWRYRGYPWREGSVWRHGYTHLLPPNSPFWLNNSDWWQLATPASTYHPGGASRHPPRPAPAAAKKRVERRNGRRQREWQPNPRRQQ